MRLLYVAMTRATARVVLPYFFKKTKNGAPHGSVGGKKSACSGYQRRNVRRIGHYWRFKPTAGGFEPEGSVGKRSQKGLA